MIGILAVIWGLLLLWSLGGSIPGINWVMPGNPPPLRYTFWAGVGVFLLYYLWPWLRGMGRGAAPTTAAPGAAARPGLTWGQWFVITFIVAPLLIPVFLLAMNIGWPEMYNFIWANNKIMAAGIILASLLYGLTPPHDPDFLKGVTKWLLIATVVAVGIRFSTFWLTGGTYYSGVLDGKVVLRPFPGPIGKKGDTIRIRMVRGSYTFSSILLDPNADPDDVTSIGIQGDSALARPPFASRPEQRPTGELIAIYNNGTTYSPVGQAGGAEFQLTGDGPIEFVINEDDQILKDQDTDGELWLIVYINPQFTPGGWAETSVKRFKATLGVIAFVALAFFAFGLIWYYVPSNLGKQVAVVIAIVAISLVGWGIWGTRDAQKKQEFKKEWEQKAQETADDPFASPTAKMKARQAQETGNGPVQSESSFERAQRTVSANTGPFKIAGGLILILALLAGVRKFVS